MFETEQLHYTFTRFIMKSIINLSATSALFTAMFYAPYTTVLVILGLIVLSDIWSAIQRTDVACYVSTPITRADDAAAWDAIFEDPDADEPDTEAFNTMFAVEEEPIVLTYKELKAEIKSKYTASQRKKLGIKLNASRSVLESWL